MATVAELKKRAEYLVDDNIDVEKCIDLFNECLEDLSDDARYEKTAVFSVDSNNPTIPIPSDYIDLVSLHVKNGRMTRRAKEVSINREEDFVNVNATGDFYYEYRIFGNTIELLPAPKEELVVELLYYADLPSIEPITVDPSMGAEPSIPKRYHRALSLWVAARYFENWENNPEQRNNFRTQYEILKNEFAQERKRETRRHFSTQVYKTRGWW